MSLSIAIVGYVLNTRQDEFQLGALANQTCTDFDVIFIDPFKSKERKELLSEFSEATGIESTYVPYELPPMPRSYDWAAWNTPFLLTNKERVFRFQQWRLLPSNAIEALLSINGPVGFCRAPIIDGRALIMDTPYTLSSRSISLGIINCPGTSYGDWCIPVEQFMEINGIDEVITAFYNAEDFDMNIRWAIAVSKGAVERFTVMRAFVLYAVVGSRIEDPSSQINCWYKYGRSTDATAQQFCHESTRQRWDLPGWKQNCQECSHLFEELRAGRALSTRKLLGEMSGKEWAACTCGGILWRGSLSPDDPLEYYRARMNKLGIYKASTGINGFGRNLQKIRDDCQKLSDKEERIELINKSWTNTCYL